MLFAYLIGRRRAILEIAADPKALLVAALLVVSAGLARNYDRASLMHEPWRLLGPFVASLAISGPLFLCSYGLGRRKGMADPGIARAYLTFLSLYWMTAPLAWLYGIPYERMLSPLGATIANLRTLALVSVWRVALMIRVVSVVFDMPIRAALALVMLVVDVAALTALYLVPLPVIHIMGGISPEQHALAWSALLVTVLCWLTLPLWIGLAAAAYAHGRTPAWRVPSTRERPASVKAALAFAALSVLGWALPLPFTQPEQILAHRVEQAYRISGPAAALTLMSIHRRIDFPPDWQPPPRKFPGEPPIGEVLDMLEALANGPRPDWIADLYARSFQDRVRQDLYEWPEELLTRHAVRLAAILTRLPQGPAMARALQHPIPSIDMVLDDDRLERQHLLAKDQIAALDSLLRLAGEGRVEPVRAPTVAEPGEHGKHHE